MQLRPRGDGIRDFGFAFSANQRGDCPQTNGTNEGTVPYGLREWSLANPDAADLPPPISTWNASWLWPMFDNIDMLTAARVQSIAIKNKTTTLATEYARQGKNWRTELAQFEKEQQFLAKHGLDK